MNTIIGRVISANTRGFVFGTRVPKTDVPVFGSLVKTKIAYRDTTVFGLIYDIQVLEDGMTKMLSVADNVKPEDIAFQRRRRVPVEAHVLLVGYREGAGAIRHGLPAQPPITLDEIACCEPDEVSEFTQKQDFFRIILESRDCPADELIAASVREAGAMRGESQRKTFALECGRELARLLANDGARLEGLLRRIQ
ncbi:MAG TPA: hypothetical protein PLJ62_04395 [Thermoflexales bacterium]|nr:hypothetical protein [Thermoflexales bacterium]